MDLNWGATLLFVAMVSYLVGAIPFGLLAGKIKGVDIREKGSKNIGATNAGRLLGKKIFFLVLILDGFKGFAPTFFSPWIIHVLGWKTYPMVPLVAGIFSILGHVFPVYLRFKGGKGVATSAGVFLGLSPLAMMVALFVWMVVLFWSGYMSLASILGALALGLSNMCLNDQAFLNDLPETIACVGVFFLLVIRHRTNIVRLWKGEEHSSPLFKKKDINSIENKKKIQ